MLHIVESSKRLARLVADLEQAVTRNKFGQPAPDDATLGREMPAAV